MNNISAVMMILVDRALVIDVVFIALPRIYKMNIIYLKKTMWFEKELKKTGRCGRFRFLLIGIPSHFQ